MIALLTSALLCLSTAPSRALAATAPRAVTFAERDWETINAQVAGDNSRLVVSYVVRERSGDPATVRVVERSLAGAWRHLPAPSLTPTLDGPVGLALASRGPCVGASETDGVAIECLEDGAWVAQPSPAGARERMRGLTIHRGVLTVLLGSGPNVRVATLGGNGQWSRLGRELPGSVANFGAGGALLVGIERFRGGRAVRDVWRLRSGRWRCAGRLAGREMGSQTSGPVRSRDRLLLPVNEVTGERWTFSVFAHAGRGWQRLGGAPLNRGRGKAQGVLSLAGARPWAIWQENRPVDGGLFQTAVYAATLGRRIHGRPRRLWSGRSIGPSDLSVVRAQGSTWALYMPGRSRTDPRLRVVVEPVITRR